MVRKDKNVLYFKSSYPPWITAIIDRRNDRFWAYKYKASNDMIYEDCLHKMQKRNQCLILSIKISLIAHFNKLTWKDFGLSSCSHSSQFWVLTVFLFFKSHNENAKIGVLENLEIKIPLPPLEVKISPLKISAPWQVCSMFDHFVE